MNKYLRLLRGYLGELVKPILIGLGLSLISCVSTTEISTPKAGIEIADRLPNQGLVSEAKIPVVQSEILSGSQPIDRESENNGEEIPEYFRRFCSDSIYSQYLTKVYYSRLLKQKNRPPTKFNSYLNRQANYEAVARFLPAESSPLDQIPLANHPKVDMWVAYFAGTRGRQDFVKWLARSKNHGQMLPILKEAGLPKELFYLAMVESGFSNSAYSHAHAVGTWQFIKPTARHYGLKVNYWVDERRDPEKATRAASRYLNALHKRLDNWFLTMAAYNAGPGKIKRAVRKAGSRDYWKIAGSRYLSRETKQYVAKILAARKIGEHQRRYGFYIFDRDQSVSGIESLGMTSIAVEKPTRLRDLAQAIGVSFYELKRWNPELIRNITPPPHNGASTYLLRLARPFDANYYNSWSQVPHLEVEDVLVHTVLPGDTLTGLASKYRISISKIMSINPKIKPTRLAVGSRLAIPVPTIKVGQAKNGTDRG